MAPLMRDMLNVLLQLMANGNSVRDTSKMERRDELRVMGEVVERRRGR